MTFWWSRSKDNMDNRTENNIQRVRHLMSFDLSIHEIRNQCLDMSNEEVFLAYQAAKILDTKHPLEEA